MLLGDGATVFKTLNTESPYDVTSPLLGLYQVNGKQEHGHRSVHLCPH